VVVEKWIFSHPSTTSYFGLRVCVIFSRLFERAPLSNHGKTRTVELTACNYHVPRDIYDNLAVQCMMEGDVKMDDIEMINTLI